MAITKTEIFKDPNNYYKLEVYSDLPCNETIPKRVPAKRVKDGVYYYGENDDGIVNFGFLHDEPTHRPGEGELWSSNSWAIRDNLGFETMEIVVIPKEGYRMAAAMLVKEVKKYLPKGYHIGRESFNGFDIIQKD